MPRHHQKTTQTYLSLQHNGETPAQHIINIKLSINHKDQDDTSHGLRQILIPCIDTIQRQNPNSAMAHVSAYNSEGGNHTTVF
eukprot:scaffold4829_cov129-Cylindrotheca_fusiformis.AAC.19